jgi:hypothetical protein
MATRAKWAGMAALMSVILLGIAPRRAEAVINPLFHVPFGVNPHFRVRPGLTLAQAYYNTIAMGQAYSAVPPYALGYNPYVPMYATPVVPAYSAGYVYPGGAFPSYGSGYVPLTSGYGYPPPANAYVPQQGMPNQSPSQKGLERLAGLTQADGSLDWPLGLRVLPPASETDPLRRKISTAVVSTVDRAEDGKVPRSSVQQVNRDIDRLEALLNERAADVPLTDEALGDARRYLRRLKERINGLPTESK